MKILYCKVFSKRFPPHFYANYDKFFAFILIADSAMMNKLQQAAIAPIKTRVSPIAHPVAAKTLGRDRTPDPIAEAHNENILPLRLPLLSFPKALLNSVLL
jgi:hypothetical protein